MITRKVGPALAAGCTVAAKSPGETPFTIKALAELSRRAEIPRGVVNIVTSLQKTAEAKEISFTGSTQVGKLLMQQAATTLKKSFI